MNVNKLLKSVKKTMEIINKLHNKEVFIKASEYEEIKYEMEYNLKELEDYYQDLGVL